MVAHCPVLVRRRGRRPGATPGNAPRHRTVRGDPRGERQPNRWSVTAFGRGHEVPRVGHRRRRRGVGSCAAGRCAGRPSRPAGGRAACVGGWRGMSGFEQTGSVPSRRRPKSPKPEPQDPVEQFAALLRESAERERAAQDRIRLERQRARDAAAGAAAHAAALERLAASSTTRSETHARRVERGQVSPPPTQRGVKPRPGSSSWRPARRPLGASRRLRRTGGRRRRRRSAVDPSPRHLGSSSRSR